MIVPQGLLTRSDANTKRMLLSNCNLLGSIALPRNTFFNAPQKTYILILEKRHSLADPRPSVFCGIARSVGESLDARRVPTPAENDLATISTEFTGFWSNLRASRNAADGEQDFQPNSGLVKITHADSFLAEDRWDAAKFWNSDELVNLGVIEPAIGRTEFIGEAISQIEAISKELSEVEAEVAALTSVPCSTIIVGDCERDIDGEPILVLCLDDEGMPLTDDNGKEVFKRIYAFKIRRGNRVTKSDCDQNPGDPDDSNDRSYPVYSGSKDSNRPLGNVGAVWLQTKGIPIENKDESSRGIITVNANGYVGAVFVRTAPCVIHDDVMIIEVLRSDMDLEYVAAQLRSSIAGGSFEYEAKLYSRVGSLTIDVPTSDSGYDLAQQEKIASALRRFNAIRSRIADFGSWGTLARIKEG